MYYQLNLTTNLEINSLSDLPKLKLLMGSLNMKVNKSKLAQEFGVDRRTINKYLNGFQPKKERKTKSKIDDYYDIITSLLSKESKQIFYYKRVLWQYLKDNHGLSCGSSTFRKYIHDHEEFQSYFNHKKKKSTSNEVIRFETPPGEQAQIDWKENIRYVTRDGEILFINVAVFLLSYSRFRTFHLAISKSQSILLSFLVESFEAIGGVPKTILSDNMKTVMDEPRTEYKTGKINNRFEQFSKDMGFELKPCIAGRPQTKAKVEAPMKLLDEIHAYQGKFNYEELHAFVSELCNRINHSYHQGTGKIPILALEKEKNLLSLLPSRRLRDSYKVISIPVKVNTSNMITYQSRMYSVPSGYIGKILQLQVYDNQLHIYYNMDLLAVHSISNQKMNYKIEHYVETLARGLPKHLDIDEVARKNLQAINEVYKNE